MSLLINATPLSFTNLNKVCPYFTMFPISFPFEELRERGKIGDWVIDPFCGRGTTNFAARLLGMPSMGMDSNPVAVAIAKAKLACAEPNQVVELAKTILDTAKEPTFIPTGDFWELVYHKNTLTRLCQLRETLINDCSSSTSVLLRAIILGALHGPRPKGTPSYFSNQSPRTYAPKPNYAVKYWMSHGMRPNEVDVISIIKSRADRYLSKPLPDVKSKIELGDSRVADSFRDMPKARFVITSPPYFGMKTYLPDQWLRLWFLGGPDYVEYRQSEKQLKHSSAAIFAAEMGSVWKNMAARTSQEALMIIRYGGIHDRAAEPMDILNQSLVDSGWRMESLRKVPDSVSWRRQAQQFLRKPRKAIKEFDVFCYRD
ncbi:MAG: site-specific DNA-methyltransferase [Deltaproteobacteria bacterium]|jgi:hypothetical protein|nr:site-specific DNA-methyltransferase [Deltaproteobacteria bacterium]